MKKIFPTIIGSLVCWFVSMLVSSPTFAADSTTITPTATITTTAESIFPSSTIPTLNLSSTSSLSQKFTSFISQLKGAPLSPVLVVTGPQGKTVLDQNIKSGKTQLALNQADLTPGEYELTINAQPVLSFSWGVLTLNYDQDHYKPGEQVYLQMASLSSSGHTLCDSSLLLTVGGQILPVQKSSTCGADNVTDSPDYFASYTPQVPGRYTFSLTNQDTGLTLTNSISVAPTSLYTITRAGATRINPFKSDYEMRLKVIAQADFSGEIKEKVPAGFKTLSPTTWPVHLTAGQEQTFTYRYQAPKLSPEIFFLGPLSIGDYQESRQWQLASDATFQMQTGYYVGTGTDNFAITGLGFQPNLVIIKDDTAGGNDGANFKTSAMSGEVSSALADTDVDVASNAIQSLDSDGFTLGTDADVNAANIRFTWTAFAGSDCTSSGTFCVGSYTGNGTSQSLTSVGFQPDMVTVKRSGVSSSVFRSSSMGTNASQPLDGANELTDSITTLDATGFTVSNNTRVNTSSDTYWFFAFKTTTNAFAVGTFTGDGADNKAITVGFRPQSAWIKNSNATTPVTAYYENTESNGDYSSAFADNINSTGIIKSLDSNGYTVGTGAAANESGKAIYWIAFAGATNPTATGTFTMKVGSYTGNGTSQSISNVGFAPDLVIIKDQSGATTSVFRTRLKKGDATSYMAESIADFTGGITSLDSSGFSVGASTIVNTSSTIYEYQAFGNAFNPETNTGAADFTIGAYSGNSGDSRNILRQPFQPDFIFTRRVNANSPAWKTSEMSGDLTSAFNAGAENADYIQAINSDGFQVGTAARTNGAGGVLFFFSFKTGANMKVGTYTGTASAQNITTPGINPNLVWVKNAGAVKGVFRPSTISGDSTLYFDPTAAVTDRVTAFLSNGFSVGGNQTETNTSGSTYRYAVWNINSAPTTPSLDSPADSATNQSLTPALLTTTTDPNSDYLRYKIQLCENVGMTTNCQTFDQTSSQTGWSGQDAQTSTAYASGTQATYTIQSALANSFIYYWRSYAIDPGGTNTWSSTQTPYSFTTLASGGTNQFSIEGINMEGININ